MSRILAALVAIGMIAGAIAVRHRIDNRHEAATVATARLVCSTELASVCNALAGKVAVTIEPAGMTFDRLSKADDPGLDGWLTAGPWPAMLEAARAQAGRPPMFSPLDLSVAHAPVGAAIFPDRRTVLERRCTNAVTWKCLGDVAKLQTWKAAGGDERWGSIKLGIGDPTTTGDGLATLVAGTEGWFGRPAVSTDIDDPGYQDWVSALARVAPLPSHSMSEMLAAGPSLLDAALAPDALLKGELASSARQPKPTILYPSPMVDADVELGVVGTVGASIRALVRGADGRAAFSTAGWAAGQRRAPGVDPRAALAARDFWRTSAR